MAVNRKYKSTVFSLLFSEPKILGELYGALEGVPPAPESAIEMKNLGASPEVSSLDRKFIILVGVHTPSEDIKIQVQYCNINRRKLANKFA
jgi:hypothetical protein